MIDLPLCNKHRLVLLQLHKKMGLKISAIKQTEYFQNNSSNFNTYLEKLNIKKECLSDSKHAVLGNS